MKYLVLLIVLLIAFLSLNCYAYRPGDRVTLGTTASCPACTEAKILLKTARIPFKEIEPTNISMFIPQLFVNGKYLGNGVDTVEDYIRTK